MQTSASPPPVLVEDQSEHRIRRPADLLRCLACIVGVVVLAGLGIVASATADGVETNIVEVSKAVPHAVLDTVRPIALFALLALSLALAIRQLVRRQPRALAEAVATGVLAGAAVTATNYLLRHRIAWRLYDAITMSKPDVSHTAALDGYLAALVAYAAMLGLGGRQARWRTTMWVLICIYALANLSASTTTILSLLITVLAGGAIGLGVRYAAGVIPTRPTAEDIAGALSSAGCPVTEMRRVWLGGTEAESRRYAAVTPAGGRLNVAVYDWDQQAAGLLYRLYRLVRLQRQVSRGAPLSQDRAVERLALLSYAARDADVPMPRLRALVQAGQEAAVLAYEHHDGTTLANYAPEPTDAQLGRVWDDVLRLHAHRVTHRALTVDHMLLTDDGGVLLLPTPTGDVAASDLQIRLDRAQLMAEFALLVGPDRSADLALAKIPTDEIITTVPLLQAVALSRSTRHELRRRRSVLPALRKRLLTHVPGGEVAPVQLERIRLRTLVTLIASVVAAYLLAGELARDSLSAVLRSADWRWGIAALGLSALTYAGAALSLTGFVTEKLSFGLTVLAQLASSFVTLVTPGRGRRGRGQHPLPAAPEDTGGGGGRQRGRVAGGGLRHAHLAAGHLHRAERHQREQSDQAAGRGLLHHRRAGRDRGHRRGPPGRTPAAAGPGGADHQPGAAATPPDRAASPQAGRGHRRHAAAERGLHRLPGGMRPRARRLGSDRQRGGGLPDRERGRLPGPHPRRPRRDRGAAVGRAHGGRDARRGGGQRGPALPPAHLLAPGADRLACPEVPGAPPGPLIYSLTINKHLLLFIAS